MSDIKLAIHQNKHSASERWIEYCEKNKINYKLVDCTNTDIIDKLQDCDGLMWHWGQSDYKSQLYARQLTYSLELMGKKVYPDSKSCWYFDDKVGQKYLLETVGAPLVNTYIFYTKHEALKWIEKTEFPKVFKLKGGAGAINVSLVKSKQEARKKVKIAFGKGFPAYSRKSILREKFRKFLMGKDLKSFINFMKSLIRLLFPDHHKMLLNRDKGYIYFQDFVADLNKDNRLIVIGDRCFGTIRYVRKNDFRASGSGYVDVNPELFDNETIKTAFRVYDLVGAQTLAMDFLDDKGTKKMVEMSYGFPVIPSDNLPGYWDRELNWHEGLFKSQYWMIENFINEIKKSKSIN